MANGLYFYKLVSPYSEDVTKNCKLTINEIDSNFLTLKDNDIKKAEFVREEKTLILTRNNGEKLIVPLKDVVYNLEVETGCNPSGSSITIKYDCVDGPKTVTLGNLLTYDNLREILGSDILTKVITDGTLKGNGTLHSPLGINGVEKTGMLAPVIEVFDLTSGGTLPEVAKLGTRYITKEYVSDYGYLYNGAGVDKIKSRLEESKSSWRVPSKADWDALLNSIEPCEYRNHDSAKCHIELGKYAGKYLKSECSWVGQPVCECTNTKPSTGCNYDFTDENYTDESEQILPQDKPNSPIGVDKYGMTILPAGSSSYNKHFKKLDASSFREKAIFWTSTILAEGQDTYVKEFDFDMGGVYQVAECPLPYYSVRLVKDYDGSNYFDSEYIDGVLYKTILFPESGQVWLATNYANKEGFVTIHDEGIPEVADVNNGMDVDERRIELFVNEWNGEYWDRKALNEGDTVVVENPCFDQGTGTTTNVCWTDKNNVPHCIEVEIPKVAQSNIEYRVYTEEDCDKTLVNTDDLVVERVVHIIVPMIQQEREERIEADEILSGAIETEREERISADTELWEALAEETSARTEADEELDEKIDAEIERAISAETALDEKIDAETERAISAETILDEKIDAETERAISAETILDEKIDAETERATEREDEIEQELFDEIERATEAEEKIDGQLIDWSKNPFTMTAAVGNDEYGVQKPNLELISKDAEDHPEHIIKIQFDGNFGEI